MPFQGNQNQPDVLGFALQLMQLKREREDRDRRFQLEQQQLAQGAQQAQLKSVSDFLDLKSKQFDLEQKQRDAAAALGPSAADANDTTVAPQARQASANQFVQGLEAQIGAGQSPEFVGRNAGRAAAEIEAKRQRTRANTIETERRGVQRKIAEEARSEQRKIEGEQRAQANDGRWSSADLNSYRKDREKELAFVSNSSMDRRRLEAINVKKPLDVLELVQRWQKKVDEGAVVREGDIALIRSVGASGVDNAFAAAKSWFDANKSLPEGFGESLRDSFESMLDDEDLRVTEIADEIEAFADNNEWGDRARNRAIPFRRQIQSARDRVQQKIRRAEEVTSIAPPTRTQYRATVDSLRDMTGKSEQELTNEEVLDFWRATQIGSQRSVPSDLSVNSELPEPRR